MSTGLVWFRQDLRLNDNFAFIAACQNHDRVLPVYIMDEHTKALGGASQWWLHHSLQALDASLNQHGLAVVLRQGEPFAVLQQLISEAQIDAVYWNRLYEPQAIKRDKKLKTKLKDCGTKVFSFNSSLLHEPWQISNKAGKPFKVFTAFWRHCANKHTNYTPQTIDSWPKQAPGKSELLSDWDLTSKVGNRAASFARHWQPGEAGACARLQDFIQQGLGKYKTHRDVMAANATSKLSAHLHFGEISPHNICYAITSSQLDNHKLNCPADKFLSEIGWREFCYHLLFHFPSLATSNFKPEFDAFPWQQDKKLLSAWQNGATGYPIIDAAMRELWETGYMHNRMRMVVASFLTKDLLLHWRHGANWFWQTLVDADLANNSAGWQWVAGCGADAAPFFRIFNPVLQSQKFDPDGDYIRTWLPELANINNKYIHQPWLAPTGSIDVTLGQDYPWPIVQHQQARRKALECFQAIKNGSPDISRRCTD